MPSKATFKEIERKKKIPKRTINRSKKIIEI